MPMPGLEMIEKATAAKMRFRCHAGGDDDTAVARSGAVEGVRVAGDLGRVHVVLPENGRT